MASRTSIRRASRTIAWTSCRRRWGDLVAVLGAINRMRSDDDLVADNLLNQRSKGLKVKPERHLDRLVADGRRDGVAPRPGSRQDAESAARAVGDAVTGGGRGGGEKPTPVGWGQRRGTGRDAAVWGGGVGAWGCADPRCRLPPPL